AAAAATWSEGATSGPATAIASRWRPASTGSRVTATTPAAALARSRCARGSEGRRTSSARRHDSQWDAVDRRIYWANDGNNKTSFATLDGRAARLGLGLKATMELTYPANG